MFIVAHTALMESVDVCSPHLRDPVQWVHELGTLSSQ